MGFSPHVTGTRYGTICARKNKFGLIIQASSFESSFNFQTRFGRNGVFTAVSVFSGKLGMSKRGRLLYGRGDTDLAVISDFRLKPYSVLDRG